MTYVCRLVFETVAAFVFISFTVTVAGERNDNTSNSDGNCLSHHYPCNNGRCIESGLVCNGFDNCGDNSDERSGCYYSDERYWWKSVIGVVIAACLIIAAASCYVRKRLQMREGHRFANQNGYPPAPESTSLPTQSHPQGYPSTTTNTQMPECTLWTTRSPILPPPYSKEDKVGVPSAPPPPYSTIVSEQTVD